MAVSGSITMTVNAPPLTCYFSLLPTYIVRTYLGYPELHESSRTESAAGKENGRAGV